MKAFPLCAACRSEYEDPSDRRFHAEPVACAACGPTVRLRDRAWRAVAGDPIRNAAGLLRDGSIVAIKGLGGFHLACDATDDRAVALLRTRKHRPDKPFAVMVADLEAARSWFDVSTDEAAVLSSPAAPIVLTRDRGRLSPAVAPGYVRQGAMLPATPLHHLLLREFGGPLVMTSGNATDEPICVDDEEARHRLRGIADAFVVHDRTIVARYDDSVTFVRGEQPTILRRARSYAPAPFELPATVAPVLGVGAELNTSFCLAKGHRAFLSQHVGTIDSDLALAAFGAAVDRHRTVFDIEPAAVAHDAHPDFLTTRYAASLGLPMVAVQHHHAHVAAVMAEHRLQGPVIGIAFDGFGLGDDGMPWGGEFLLCDWNTSRRMGSLRRVAQPGGDAAVRDPVRMAIAYAADAGCLDGALEVLGATDAVAEPAQRQIATGVNAPLTSSAGRLFDAIAALTGVCRTVTHDGQPAILLEQAAEASATREYPFDLTADGPRMTIDTRPMIAAIVKDLKQGRSAEQVAGRFHRTLAAAVAALCRVIKMQTNIHRVCLAGGVFANDLLVSDVGSRLTSHGFEVFVPRQVPVGDGGVSLGQVLVAHARLTRGAV
jgi:hydrogenase maturation protein HypF